MRALVKLIPLVLMTSIYQSAHALTFPLHENTEVVGEVMTFPAKWEDTFAIYARTHNMGAYQLMRANPGVDEWVPGTDTPITIPAQFILPKETRQGVVINLPELRLYYLDEQAQQVFTYPIGIGKDGWATPTDIARITEKTKDPTWVVPQSILAEHAASGEPIPGLVNGTHVPPGEANPLGQYRLRLNLPGYLIHGTNSPIGVGRRVTHGCIRLFPEDIESLFNLVDLNTRVYIINEPIKVGWQDNELYLEVHPMLDEHAATENGRKVLLVDVLESALATKKADINWNVVHKMMNAQTGVPQIIGYGI